MYCSSEANTSLYLTTTVVHWQIAPLTYSEYQTAVND